MAGRNIKEFLSKTKVVTGWFISMIFLIGMFCGVILAVLFMLSGIL